MNDAVTMTRPKLVVVWGRGGRGKSTLVRLLAERAIEGGNSQITMADGNRENATLRDFCETVIQPDGSEEEAIYEWLEDIVNLQVVERRTVILDMGGGDQVFPVFAKDLDLVSLLDSAGIEPVMLYCISQDTDDLYHVKDMSNVFCPPATALVLNEGIKHTRKSREVTFAAVRKHATYKAALSRGCREVWLPRLGCMQEVTDGKLTFGAAETKLSYTSQTRIRLWRKQIEAEFASIRDMLP